jgi:D-amino-acid dehydrogenase
MRAKRRAGVTVIGAGIVGAAIALELQKRGHDVTLVDRDEPGRGCSFGNSGAISPGSVAPLALPGVLASVPRMLLDAQSPLRVPMSYLPRALPWLVRFVASATPQKVARAAARLDALHAGAVCAPRRACEGGWRSRTRPRARASSPVSRCYRAGERPCRVALARAIRYVPQRLDRAGIVALEPDVDARYTTGMFLADHATVRNPFRYVQAIVRKLVERGGELERDDVRALAAHGGDGR